MRTPGSQGSSELAGQPLWTITVWPVTPHYSREPRASTNGPARENH